MRQRALDRSRRKDAARRQLMAEYRRYYAAVRDPVREAEQREETAKCRQEARDHGLQANWLRRAWR